MEAPYRDRIHGGRELAQKLRAYAGRSDVLVLALPRGGVPVAFEVANALRVPLDVLLVRKLGVPGHEELAFGAIAHGGVRVLNEHVLDQIPLPEQTIERVARVELQELERREKVFRGTRPFPDLHGKVVILVDDGLATGATMRAAIRAVRSLSPQRIVAAAPVGASSTCFELAELADELVCPVRPEDFLAVGYWYEEFGQTSDDEVRELLGRARRDDMEPDPARVEEEDIALPVEDSAIGARLSIPPHAKGTIIFAHGSGSGRFSPRNRQVADHLVRAGFSTLLADLLTTREDAEDRITREYRFDIELLAERVVLLVDWLSERESSVRLPIGIFGASTGAAAALVAAARRPDRVAAVVARGGRPDLAARSLAQVHCPTLFLVGSEDEDVLVLNREALKLVRAQAKHLEIVPGATHLFEEPGTLDIVASSAARWFDTYLTAAAAILETPSPG